MADRIVSVADGRIHHITVNDHKRKPSELTW
jgi:hypothetical protein